MRGDKILVVIEDKEHDRLIEKIARDAIPGWKDAAHFIGFPSKPKRLGETRDQLREHIENEISRSWNNDAYVRILLDKSLAVDEPRLRREGVRMRCTAHHTIYQELIDELKKRKLHWDTHSRDQWENSSIRHLDPQAWREQFIKLGYGWIAEGLLKQVRVVGDAELGGAFRVGDAEMFGLNVAHGCVKDSAPGSSSGNVKDILEHIYPSKAFEVDLTVDHSELFSEHDTLYLYEDGLWSGVELVSRLEAVAKWSAVKQRALRVVFKFGVTSDAGLFAARNFVKRERLTTVEISAGIIAHHQLLAPGAISEIVANAQKDDQSVRRELDRRVCSSAFDSDSIWAGRAEEAKEVCQKIGRQLAAAWIQREKKKEATEEEIEKWSLGAYRYASMTSFAKSVPKPVLPLLWLDGQIEMQGKKETWRPLFWDARRTGKSPPPVGRGGT